MGDYNFEVINSITISRDPIISNKFLEKKNVMDDKP